MIQPPNQSEFDRAVAIRDYVIPLIQAMADVEKASTAPVLIYIARSFTLGYRRTSSEEPACGDRNRLDVRRRKRLMRIEWSDVETKLVSFRGGEWEREIMRLP
jgi:hypothetical protein